MIFPHDKRQPMPHQRRPARGSSLVGAPLGQGWSAAARSIAAPCAIALWFVGVGLASGPLGAQSGNETIPENVVGQTVASEELADPEMALVPLGEPSPVDAETADQFASAEARFNSIDQPAAIPLLSQVIARLEPMTTFGHPDDEAKDLLARALVLRATAQLNLGEDEGVDADLERAIRIRPARDLDRALSSPKLVARFDDLRTRLLGFVAASIVDPPDLELRIDGHRVDPLAGPMAALAGPQRIVAQRIGFAPFVSEIEVEAGDTVEIELLLERVAPVLRLNTRPSGATIYINGVPHGATQGTAEPDFVPAGAAARFLREEFSAQFALGELPLGQHQLEIRHPGYRPYRANLSMFDAIDYEIPPVVLERERGTLLLRGLPANATLTIDGQTRSVERRDQNGRLDVEPGEHRLLIEEGPAQMFARNLRIADRQTIEIDVELKPGLGLLGVLGGDREAGASLARRLVATFDKGRFTAIEHDAEAALATLGLDASALRERPADMDWRQVQREIAKAYPAMVYILPILSDDLLATHAELMIWAPPSAPPTPDRIRIALDNPSALDGLAMAFNKSLALRRPWLGVQLIDGAEGRPVVAHVSEGGPASSLTVGDQISSVDGAAVSSTRSVLERVAAAEIGEPMVLGVVDGNQPGAAGTVRDVRLVLGASPAVLAPSADKDNELALTAAVFVDLALLAARVEASDRWLVRLNTAKALLDAGEWVDAARELRSIEAPAQAAGVGAGTVDYWLGVALNGAGASYLESARAAFERAANAHGARLFHNDGPWVAPRARARLRALAADPLP